MVRDSVFTSLLDCAVVYTLALVAGGRRRHPERSSMSGLAAP